MDCRIIPSEAEYITAQNKTRFITDAPCYADRVVRLLTGTMGTLSLASGSITNASVANPTVVTSAGHGLETGMVVTIAGSNSTPTIDGDRTVTVTGDNTFTVAVNVTVQGTAGTWESADRRGFMATGNFTGGEGAVLGCVPEFEVELSEPVVRGRGGVPVLGPTLLVRDLYIYHRSAGGFTVEVSHIDPSVRATETYEWDPDLTESQSRTINQFLARIAAVAEDCTVSIGENDYKPIHIHGLDWELETMGRAR